jgi:hypothetical protein
MPWWRSPRIRSVALVAAVHVLLVAFLLASLSDSRLALPSPREIFFILRPVPPARLPQKIEPPLASPVAPPLFQYAPSRLPVVILPPKGLTLSLFGCAPENLANLTSEERAHCSGRIDATSLRGAYPGAPLDRSLQAERWLQAIRDHNTPLTVPCTYAEKQPDGSGAVMMDLVCLARLAAHER